MTDALPTAGRLRMTIADEKIYRGLIPLLFSRHPAFLPADRQRPVSPVVYGLSGRNSCQQKNKIGYI